MISLIGKTVLVTGASSGIGRATAVLASQLGANLVISGRNREELLFTLSSLQKDNHQSHIALTCDFSLPNDMKIFLEKILEHGLKIDGVAHCAGISITEPLRFIEENSVDNIFDINVKSAIYLVSGLKKKRLFNIGASVVLLSSVKAQIGEPGVAVYSASKGAIIALTKSLAAELVLPDKIRVNCLAPAIVKTKLITEEFKNLSAERLDNYEKEHPLGFGQPEDVASPILFLLSNAAKWITGSCLTVDGGYSLQARRV